MSHNRFPYSGGALEARVRRDHARLPNWTLPESQISGGRVYNNFILIPAQDSGVIFPPSASVLPATDPTRVDSTVRANPYGAPIWKEEYVIEPSNIRALQKSLGRVFAVGAVVAASLVRPSPAEAAPPIYLAKNPTQATHPTTVIEKVGRWARDLSVRPAHDPDGTGGGPKQKRPTAPPSGTPAPPNTPTPAATETHTAAQIAQEAFEKQFTPRLAELRRINASNRSALQPQTPSQKDIAFLRENYPGYIKALTPWKLRTFRDNENAMPEFGVLTITEPNGIAMHTAFGVYVGTVYKPNSEVEPAAITYAANHGGEANPGDMVIFIGKGDGTGDHFRNNMYIAAQYGTDYHGQTLTATKLRVGFPDINGVLVFRAVQVMTPKGSSTSIDVWKPDELSTYFGLVPGAIVQLRGDPNLKGQMSAAMVSVVLDREHLDKVKKMVEAQKISLVY